MRFTIRDLLWLTLLAAVLVAWWVDRKTSADWRAQVKRQAESQAIMAAEIESGWKHLQEARWDKIGEEWKELERRLRREMDAKAKHKSTEPELPNPSAPIPNPPSE